MTAALVSGVLILLVHVSAELHDFCVGWL